MRGRRPAALVAQPVVACINLVPARSPHTRLVNGRPRSARIALAITAAAKAVWGVLLAAAR
jgi:hypothetical protein